MNTPVTLTTKQLSDFLLNTAVVRPVFIWGPPGIGKSSLVQQFSEALGLSCVSLLGSQLAPEDIIGVPQIVGGKSHFCPPVMIARNEAYCLFLDELNACSHEVQKAFYSLILERRIGEYHLPEGSIVIGAGNRVQDNAIVKPMSSALINRMVHVHLKPSHRDWLEWANYSGLHPWVIQYIQARPDHLWSQPPKHEEPFSTPRSWHMLSDLLHEAGSTVQPEMLEILAYACLSPHHAAQFKAFFKQLGMRFQVHSLIKGDMAWPRDPQDRDVLYFMAQSFRAHLIKSLPQEKAKLTQEQIHFGLRAKVLIKDLSQISLEMAQMVVSKDGDDMLPAWFMVELVRDLPKLVEEKSHAR